MSRYTYFSERDFAGADPACSIEQMNPEFLSRLDRARAIAGVPFVVNSAYRSVEHEKSRGRNGTSTHTKGLAVDIRTRHSHERYRILKGLLDEGFSRVGIGEGFVHADMDPEKPHQLVWDYYPKPKK